jgi:acyl-CoA reductase-like NAD-dependent aldehyde dehydrogenase
MKIVQEEIFGPVCTVVKFEDEEDVVRQANDSLYGLAAAVFTQDINRALETGHKLKAGTVWINCVNVLNANVPFGGFKQSGSTYYSFSRCPPPNLILITSDLQSAASWESTRCTTTPKLRRSTSTWAKRCKLTEINV